MNRMMKAINLLSKFIPLIWAGLAIYNFLIGVPSLGIGFMVLHYLDRQEPKQ
jgi:hypothetical protein